MRSAVRTALVTALSRLRDSADVWQGAPALRAWKLFVLAPRMLLARTAHRGAQGRAELLARATAFQRGDWIALLEAARRATSQRRSVGAAMRPSKGG